ncbi:MAG: sugar phosphate nucleotidyltransferase [Dehalococcoidales bacterium]|nr:sugar phosphate nucleotidyltransferase [Dehalococcoidales bacterium]
MKQAIILAAGQGQRLKPFTVSRPKPMLAIAGRPILEFIIEALSGCGIRDIVLVVGYRRDQIYDYFGAGEKFGVSISYVTQPSQLGSADALLQARDAAEDEFLVLPGDNLIEAATLAGFTAVNPPAVLVKRVDNPGYYGVVEAAGGEVRGIVEKPREASSNLVNTGIYAFRRDVFDSARGILDLPDVINSMTMEGCPVKIVETTGTWLDVVYPWDILSLNEAVLKNTQTRLGGTVETGVSLKGAVVIGEGTVIRSGSCIYGPVVIGSGCDIGPQVCIMPATSIGSNVTISPFTEIKNSVIGDDCVIGPGCIIVDSVIDRGCVFSGRFTALGGESEVTINGEAPSRSVGVLMGEECRVESATATAPGTIIGNYCQIRTGRTVRGKLPDHGLVY